MPAFDGSGPWGQGPMTGWGRGGCAPWAGDFTNVPMIPAGYRTTPYRTGFGRGRALGRGFRRLAWFGFGRGRGRSFGRGRGRGWRW